MAALRSRLVAPLAILAALLPTATGLVVSPLATHRRHTSVHMAASASSGAGSASASGGAGSCRVRVETDEAAVGIALYATQASNPGLADP